ncbi:hypothetical protein NHX12_029068 [Muraenolepis orangiensis]|uniref:Uncharacterized protein n=1 Tax=Muraenolepis orangiensis TaxID=630683 RepID=A0A9Q0EAI6_9TELE|nr:hypothetical protein NHX12_029068 [Muraenolepis orangiensis]
MATDKQQQPETDRVHYEWGFKSARLVRRSKHTHTHTHTHTRINLRVCLNATAMDPKTKAKPQPRDPVYKERLRVKYLKPTRKKPSLDVSLWRFMNDILADEDGDDGPPRPRESSGGILPVDLNSRAEGKTVGRARRSISKEQACFSRQVPARQTRRERVAALERKLLQHPLGLHDHYQRNMPPELFEQVLLVLDPDMCVSSKPKAPKATSEHREEGKIRKESDQDQDSTPANEKQVPRPDDQYVGLRDDVAQDDKDISNLTRGFRQWDASLRKAGSKKPAYDARHQDPSNVRPEQLRFNNKTGNKEEEWRQMFAFQAFRQYLVANHLRVPELMREIFSEEEAAAAAETGVRAGGRPGYASKGPRANF